MRRKGSGIGSDHYTAACWPRVGHCATQDPWQAARRRTKNGNRPPLGPQHQIGLTAQPPPSPGGCRAPHARGGLPIHGRAMHPDGVHPRMHRRHAPRPPPGPTGRLGSRRQRPGPPSGLPPGHPSVPGPRGTPAPRGPDRAAECHGRRLLYPEGTGVGVGGRVGAGTDLCAVRTAVTCGRAVWVTTPPPRCPRVGIPLPPHPNAEVCRICKCCTKQQRS
jgi:hypothetical protein